MSLTNLYISEKIIMAAFKRNTNIIRNLPTSNNTKFTLYKKNVIIILEKIQN